MSYQQAVAQLYELGHELARTPPHKFDLAQMRVLLDALRNPERRFRAVLIAGTNGKGSTAATLASMLRAAGHDTALYSSPHLVRVNERIRIDGRQISDEDFAWTHERVEAIARRLVAAGELPWHPSFFEVLTAMAFTHFAEAGVEIAVLEVGMGGRLDATNVVEPVVSVITDIALDHQKFLGNTITEIAREKAGIIRPGGVVITLPQHPEANDVIGHTILERGARGVSAVPFVPPVSPGAAEVQWSLVGGRSPVSDEAADHRLTTNDSPRTRYRVTVMGREILVDSPLVGRHQLRNIALAIAAAVELNSAGIAVTPEAIERGIRETPWPGRFQTVTCGGVQFVLDVAHNPAGAWALRSALSERCEGKRLILVFGVLRDKAVSEIAEILFPLAERVIATRADNPRSATPEEIREAASRTGADVECAETMEQAIERGRQFASPDAVVVITGSIYVVGEAMRALRIPVE